MSSSSDRPRLTRLKSTRFAPSRQTEVAGPRAPWMGPPNMESEHKSGTTGAREMINLHDDADEKHSSEHKILRRCTEPIGCAPRRRFIILFWQNSLIVQASGSPDWAPAGGPSHRVTVHRQFCPCWCVCARTNRRQFCQTLWRLIKLIRWQHKPTSQPLKST